LGGLISTIWSTILVAISTFYLNLSTIRGFLFGTFAYFLISIGIGILSDTIRKKQQELENNEIFLRHSQVTAGVGSIILDSSAKVLKATKTFYDILGVDDKNNNSLDDFISVIQKDCKDAVLEYYKKTIKEGLRIDTEYKIIRKNDSEERWVHVIGETLKDESGNTTKIAGAISDITSRKKEKKRFILKIKN
jgi:PAS domain S-box-containing protein